jgi:DNA-binding MarR family transcriptional regulator
MTNEQARRLEAIRSVVVPISRKHKKMPLSHFAAVVVIALRSEISAAELMSTIELDDSTVSRMTDLLSHWGRPGVEGLGLIDIRTDPNDKRRRLYSLSSKGQAFIDRLIG